jgi:hypothetical protein
MVAAIEGQTKDEKEATGRERDYHRLVEGLVSPNKPVKCGKDGERPAFPPDYDREAQDHIEKNRRILYEHCADALPYLIEGSTDPRYSLTWQSDSYAGNSCVGEVCLEIVACHIEVYGRHMSPMSKERSHAYLFVPRIHGAVGEQVTKEKKKEIEDWWRERKGKTLLELQLEALKWAIEKCHGEAGLSEEPDRAEEMKRLIAARVKLKQDHKCLPPQSMPRSVGRSGAK